MRGSLESLAARIAAERMTPAEGAILRRAMDALAAACAGGRIEEVSEADFAFHRTSVEPAEHGRLAARYNTVEQQIRLCIASTNVLNEQDLSIIVRHHEPLTTALIEGDADRLPGRHGC